MCFYEKEERFLIRLCGYCQWSYRANRDVLRCGQAILLMTSSKNIFSTNPLAIWLGSETCFLGHMWKDLNGHARLFNLESTEGARLFYERCGFMFSSEHYSEYEDLEESASRDDENNSWRLKEQTNKYNQGNVKRFD